MGAGHPQVRLTQTVSLLPRGEALTMPALPGPTYWEETADIEIAADGSVASCLTASESGSPPKYANPIFQPVCQQLRFVTFPAAQAPEVRRARIRSAVYVEVQVGRR
jgi:hypothetical protein